MKKFLVLYMAPAAEMAEMMKNTTPEQAKESMKEWEAWASSHPEIVDMGAPLGKNTRVTKDNATQESNDIGGYSFVEAESADAAAAIFKDSPHFSMTGGYVEIMECVSM